jgi:spore germination protein YaaH
MGVVALAVVIVAAGAVGVVVLDSRNRPGASLGVSAGDSVGGSFGVDPSASEVAEASADPSAGPSEPATGSPSESAAAGSPTPVPSPSGPPRVRALADHEIFGFLPYWQMSDPQTQIPLDTLTTIAIFGVEAGRDGHLVEQTAGGAAPPGWAAWNSPTTTQLIARAHAAHVRVVLTIQRFSWTANEAKRTVALLSDPARRQILAADILAELAAKHADGVNLDFEPVPAAVESEFVDFVRELRVALDSAHPGLQLTFDTTTDIGAWDLAALTADDAADAAFLMGYDFRTAAAPVAGSVDPLESISSNSLTSMLEEALSVAAPDHLILGLPWYGRAWSTLTDQTQSTTLTGKPYVDSATVEYASAIPFALQYGRNYDPLEASAWTLYRRKNCASCPVTFRQLWYDDVDGMIAKQSLVPQNNLRGLGIWALGDDADQPEAWAAIQVSLGNLVDTTAPTGGSVRVDPTGTSQKHGSLPVVTSDLKLLLSARDEPGGSGLAFVRVATDPTVAEDGSFAQGITFPHDSALVVPLTDTRLVPAVQTGQNTLYVQWRDVSGNWSAASSVSFWLNSIAPPPSPTVLPTSSEPPPSELPASEAPASESAAP